MVSRGRTRETAHSPVPGLSYLPPLMRMCLSFSTTRNRETYRESTLDLALESWNNQGSLRSRATRVDMRKEEIPM